MSDLAITHVMAESCHSDSVCVRVRERMQFFFFFFFFKTRDSPNHSHITPPALSEHLHSQRKLVTIHTLLQPDSRIVSPPASKKPLASDCLSSEIIVLMMQFFDRPVLWRKYSNGFGTKVCFRCRI